MIAILFSMLRLILILILASCAFLPDKRLDESEQAAHFYDSLKKICLSAEGKGQFQFEAEKYAFNFESLLNNNSQYWDLAVYIPMHGEELLKIHFPKEGVRLTGGFAKKILNAFHRYRQGSDLHPQSIKVFFESFGNILRFLESRESFKDCQKMAAQGDISQMKCRLVSGADSLWYFDRQHLRTVIRLDEKFWFELLLENKTDFFKKMQLSFYKEVLDNPKSVFSMKMHLSQCFNSSES